MLLVYCLPQEKPQNQNYGYYGACDVLENIKVTQKIRFKDIERYSVFVGDFSDYQAVINRDFKSMPI